MCNLASGQNGIACFLTPCENPPKPPVYVSGTDHGGGIYSIIPTHFVRSVVCTCSFAVSTPSPIQQSSSLRKLLITTLRHQGR